MNALRCALDRFLRIGYSAKGRILGASMRHYLLEKARVTAPARGERNFHVFYQARYV